MRMFLLGKVIKVTRDGRLVVKAENVPKLGVQVYNSSANLVGHVHDVIGPPSSPYVVVKVSLTAVRDPQHLVNRLLYATEGVKPQRRRKR